MRRLSASSVRASSCSPGSTPDAQVVQFERYARPIPKLAVRR
jgi:hypothetical protein